MYRYYEKREMQEIMLEGGFGLEKESLRIDPYGFLSDTSHPFPDDENIERDFCENQIELITKVCKSTQEACEELSGLQDKVLEKLWNLETGREYLWPFSNPPYVRGEGDIRIAEYHGTLKGKEMYRRYLAERYGKKKMLFSGIHFNFSFSDEMLKLAYEEEHNKTFRQFKDEIYLELTKKVTAYSWLIIYLTAASPLMDGSFFEENLLGQDIKKNYASYRCGEMGYWNDFIPILDYGSLEEYSNSIRRYITDGQLRSLSELYYPVRLKPFGENTLDNLVKTGVSHIELRMLDLNPLSRSGVMKEDIQFIHYFLIYLSSLMEFHFGIMEQTSAIKNAKRAACLDEKNIWIESGWNHPENILDAGLHVLKGMEDFYQQMHMPGAIASIQIQRKKLEEPEKRYAVRIQALYQEKYVEKGIRLAERYGNMQK